MVFLLDLVLWWFDRCEAITEAGPNRQNLALVHVLVH